jgi:hypothetical protein
MISLHTWEYCQSAGVCQQQVNEASMYAHSRFMMSVRSTWWVLHSDLNFYPYKIQFAPQLSDYDDKVHLQFCHQFPELISDNPDMPDNILICDDAHFL